MSSCYSYLSTRNALSHHIYLWLNTCSFNVSVSVASTKNEIKCSDNKKQYIEWLNIFVYRLCYVMRCCNSQEMGAAMKSTQVFNKLNNQKTFLILHAIFGNPFLGIENGATDKWWKYRLMMFLLNNFWVQLINVQSRNSFIKHKSENISGNFLDFVKSMYQERKQNLPNEHTE